MKRQEQQFFGGAIFGKSHEVLRANFLVDGLLMITATRFFKILFLLASGCL